LLEKKQDDFSAADARELNWCPPFRQLALKLAVSKAAGPFAEYRWEHRKAPDPPKLNILPNFGGADDRMWVQKCPLGAVAPLEPDDACAYELADRLMKEALARAADVVEREWANIVAVAEALKVKGELSEAAFKSLMRAPHPVT